MMPMPGLSWMLAAWLFYAPLPLDRYGLWMLLPLVASVAIVYKAIKFEDLRQLPKQATYLFLQVLVFMALAATLLWLIVELV